MNNRDRRWYQSRVRQLEKRIAELEERIEELDLLLAQWESIDELNRERSQQRLQRIAQLEAESNRRLELIRDMIVNTEYCPICRFILLEGDGPHADDCRVRKELSDAN